MKPRIGFDIETYSTADGLSALSPLDGRIVAVGWAGDDGEGCATALAAENEPDIIATALDRLCGRGLYTFAGRSFDLPYLVARAMILGVEPRPGTTRDWFKRWNTESHFDIQHAVFGGPKKGATLKALAKAMGYAIPALTGKDVDALVRGGDAEALGKYVLGDARLAFEVGTRAEAWFGL